MIILVCAWCKKVLGKKENPEPDIVSHGICKDCVKKLEGG